MLYPLKQSFRGLFKTMLPLGTILDSYHYQNANIPWKENKPMNGSEVGQGLSTTAFSRSELTPMLSSLKQGFLGLFKTVLP